MCENCPCSLKIRNTILNCSTLQTKINSVYPWIVYCNNFFNCRRLMCILMGYLKTVYMYIKTTTTTTKTFFIPALTIGSGPILLTAPNTIGIEKKKRFPLSNDNQAGHLYEKVHRPRKLPSFKSQNSNRSSMKKVYGCALILLYMLFRSGHHAVPSN